MARAGGQILLQEMSDAQVKQIVGPGAIWPQQNRTEIAQEIELEVIAGSSGMQNQAHDVQVRERIFPLLFQIPGISHEWIVRDILRVLDDRMDYEDAIDTTALSIQMMNGQAQAAANRGPEAAAGSSNAPTPQMPQRMGQMGSTPENGAGGGVLQ